MEHYRNSESVVFDDIELLINNTREDDSIEFWDLLGEDGEQQYIDLKFKTYPMDLFLNEDVKFQHLFFDGLLKNENDLFECIEVLPAQLQLPKGWKISFDIGFCEKFSKKSKKYYDVVSALFIDDRIEVGYTNRSDTRFEDEPEANYDSLTKMVEELNLPVEVNGSVERYTITHKFGGNVNTLDGDWVSQPTRFYFEMKDSTSYDTILMLKNIVDFSSIDSPFKFSWSIHSPISSATLTDEVKQVRNILTSIVLPAKSYEVSTSMFIDSLSSIEVLKNSLGKNDLISIELFQLEYEQQRVNCSTKISQRGYELYLESRYPIENIYKLNKILGFRFVAN